VPFLGNSIGRWSLGPRFEYVSACIEGGSWHFFGYIFEDELIMMILEDSNSGKIAAA
jgi:hypothetical protein